MLIIFIGAPGAGKGTQAERLAEWLGIDHLSTGELFRKAIAERTELGREASRYMERGMLVPDEVVVKMVTDYLGHREKEAGGVILDGFPRTLPQAEALGEELTKQERGICCVVDLLVDEKELVRRLLGRGRHDDTKEAIDKRLEVFQRETKPLIEYYEQRGLAERIDGVGTPDEVLERIVAVVQRRGCEQALRGSRSTH